MVQVRSSIASRFDRVNVPALFVIFLSFLAGPAFVAPASLAMAGADIGHHNRVDLANVQSLRLKRPFPHCDNDDRPVVRSGGRPLAVRRFHVPHCLPHGCPRRPPGQWEDGLHLAYFIDRLRQCAGVDNHARCSNLMAMGKGAAGYGHGLCGRLPPPPPTVLGGPGQAPASVRIEGQISDPICPP